MKNSKLIAFTLVSTAVVLLGLSSCGEDVCISGIGKCDLPNKGVTTQSLGSPASETNIYLTYSTPKVAMGNKLVLTATGGKEPRKFSIVEGSGTIDANGLYTAPLTSGYTIIRATDAENRTKDIAVIVY